MRERSQEVACLLTPHVRKNLGVELEGVRNRNGKPHATFVSTKRVNGEQFRIHYPLKVGEALRFPRYTARLLSEDAARVMRDSLKAGELKQEAS